MPINEAAFQALRLRYDAAYTAYQSCVAALSQASMSRQPPFAELVAKEAKALDVLTEARRSLLAAISAQADPNA